MIGGTIVLWLMIATVIAILVGAFTAGTVAFFRYLRTPKDIGSVSGEDVAAMITVANNILENSPDGELREAAKRFLISVMESQPGEDE